MTVEEKVEILRHLFRQISNQDVLTWGHVEGGYRWTCTNHRSAVRLAEFLLSNVDLLTLDRATFPYRFEPEHGPTLIIEPIEGDTSREW